ncbi:MAG: hypothetical protein UIH41_07300 [Treponemataceae bacterium]|nr:hypothetical protein [Treponemataceae bacterium]
MCKKICASIAFLVALITFIVFANNCALTEESNICVLIVLSVLTICSFIFFCIVLFKDDQDIRFAKLNMLARISEKLETELLLEDTLNMYKKDLTSMSPECQKIDINIKSKKNYELYKKYMDTLVDI